jgi:hypothetical protein
LYLFHKSLFSPTILKLQLLRQKVVKIRPTALGKNPLPFHYRWYNKFLYRPAVVVT